MNGSDIDTSSNRGVGMGGTVGHRDIIAGGTSGGDTARIHDRT